MMKTVFLLAFTANVFVVLVQGNCNAGSSATATASASSRAKSTSTNSSASSSSRATAKTVTTTTVKTQGGCDNNSGGGQKCTRPNEVYDLCPAKCPFRTCGIDDRLIDCRPSPTVGDPDCPPPSCRCANGFFRDDKENCVEWENCPKCNNPNEEYDACPAPCPPRRCDVDDSLILCQVPPQVGDPACKPGCRCSDNYARNDKGICIPREQCPKPESCNGDPNATPGCGVNCGRLCSNYQRDDVVCPAICYENACDCKKGYVFDSNIGSCVPPDQCTPICNENEVFSNCSQATCSPQNCSQKGLPIPCVLVAEGSCIKGCVCVDGFLRDSNGNCIPEDQCGDQTSCNGDPNAKPGCGVNCGRLCSNYRAGNNIACPAICNLNGCDCKEGFVLNTDTGKCVVPDQCPKSPNSCRGDPNAQPGCGINCGRLCSNYQNSEEISCIDLCQEDGCDCKDGYVLNTDTGLCVLPDQCPGNENPCNQPNEEYQQCPGCSPGTCESIGRVYNCPLQPSDPSKCVGACRCKPGYYRNKIGECITEDQCLTCNGPNEFFSCGPECDNVCSTLEQQNRTNCPIINVQCNKKCYCEDGYARNDDNICVPIEQCPVRTSCNGDPNAQPGCGVNCGRLCSNYKIGDQIACAAVCYPDGCDCKKGFVLDTETGKCVLPEQCPITSGSCQGDPNAKPGCGINCGQLCSNYKNSEEVFCTDICNENGCDCKLGYVLDTDTGLCVLPQNCPGNEIECNNPNEEYQQCPDCSPGTCASIGQVYNCPLQPSDPANCKGACRCKPGFYRNSIGQCITKNQCLQCNGPNEFYSCGTACDNICATLDQQNQTNCPIMNIKCNEMCYCEDGFARNSDNICIPITQCPDNCGENERYVDCPDAECVPQSCEDAGFPVSCPRFANGKCPSNPECLCNSGYFRNSDGVCVPGNQCPSCGGDPNARPGCGVNCGRLCSNYNNPDGVACPAICNINGCDCIDGYVLDTNTGKCVLPKQCTNQCGPNEVYSTCVNGGCDRRLCSQLSQPQICIDPIKCEGGCICRDGYLRDSKGVCVPTDQCECQSGEVFSNCTEGVCRIQDCSQKGQEIACIAVVPSVCTKGCLCAVGYLRNSNGKCVPEDQCESCPEGETFSNCPPVYSSDCDSEYCPRSRNDPAICPTTKQCGTPKCVCGILDKRNRETGQCVRTSDCPPFPCDGPNEEYQSCPPGCPGETCTDYLENSSCPKFRIGIVVPCKPQCRCLKGFYRNSKGICVESSQCTECPEGEIYSKCPPIQCDAEYCPQSRNYTLSCPTPKKCLRPRCICGFNSHRDRLTGKCIPTSKCPAFPCDGENEEYNSCPPVCPGQNCTDYINKTKCPKFKIGIVVPCKPACRCVSNTYRDSKGVCVNSDKCKCDN